MEEQKLSCNVFTYRPRKWEKVQLTGLQATGYRLWPFISYGNELYYYIIEIKKICRQGVKSIKSETKSRNSHQGRKGAKTVAGETIVKTKSINPRYDMRL